MSRVLDCLLFAFVYAVILGSAKPIDWAFGIALGALLPRTALSAAPRRLFGFIRFVLGMSGEILRGCWKMLLVLVGAKRVRECGYVEIPFGERTPRGAAVTAFVATSAPGTALAELDQQGRRLVFNAVDTRGAEAVSAEIEDFYQRHQRRLFP